MLRPFDDTPGMDPDGALDLDLDPSDVGAVGGLAVPTDSEPVDLADALEAAFGDEAAEEFAALPDDDSAGDAEIAGYVARANADNGREHLTALSALSQQMARYKTLTPDEQAERLAAYHAGCAAANLLSAGGLNARTERAAQARVLAGQSAQTELIASMFRLVLIIAREIAADRYGRQKALDILSDLVAEANLALVEAVTTYDPAKCPTFSIYAGRVIRDRVRMSLQKASPVGVAPSWLRLKRIYTVLRPEIEMKLGRNPSEEEMQAELRVVCMRWAADRLTDEQKRLPEVERAVLMESKLRKQGMLGAIDRLPEVLAATHQVGSLDSPLGEDGGSTLGDLLPNAPASGDFDTVEHAELRRDLMHALGTLPEREQQIVLHRFGFIDGEAWTYARLAPMYGVSAERIRQIERNVLTKLRSPAFAGLDTHLPSHPGELRPEPEVITSRRRRPLSR